jgi:hypothetical protein
MEEHPKHAERARNTHKMIVQTPAMSVSPSTRRRLYYKTRRKNKHWPTDVGSGEYSMSSRGGTTRYSLILAYTLAGYTGLTFTCHQKNRRAPCPNAPSSQSARASSTSKRHRDPAKQRQRSRQRDIPSPPSKLREQRWRGVGKPTRDTTRWQKRRI